MPHLKKPWLRRHHMRCVALLVFFAMELSSLAQEPSNLNPVGWITSTRQMAYVGSQVTLSWHITLPDGASSGNYFFYIREIVYPGGFQSDMQVGLSGQTVSQFPLEPGGSSFELWAYSHSSNSETLLDSAYCSAYSPTASVTITTEDPYSVIPRTRADRPFTVNITTNGILSGEDVPDYTKKLELLRHVQAYGSYSDSMNLDRTQATLLDTTDITTNGTQTITSLHAIPATDTNKAMGEQRFTVVSLPDTDMGIPSQIISSQYVEILPVANATILGISEGQTISPQVPNITVQMRNLYPRSTTWAQVYLGGPRTGVNGTFVPGSSVNLQISEPRNLTLVISNYGSVFSSDGPWTLEILTGTPFGIDRVAAVSFTVTGKGMTVEGWRQTHFGSTENSGDGADLHDFDSDSIPNLVEFAFGLDPKRDSNTVMPQAQRIGNDLVFEFTKPSGIHGVIYGAQWSPNLLAGSWQDIPDTGTPPNCSFRLPVNEEGGAFMRLKVSRP